MNKEPCRNSLLGMLTNWEKKNRSTPPQDVRWLYQAVGPTAGRSPRVITGKYPAVQGVGEICASQADKRWERSIQLLWACIHSWPFIMLQPFHIPVPRSWPQRSGTARCSFHACYIEREKRREAKTNQPTNHHHHTDNKNDQAAHSKKKFHANNTQISYFLELGQHKSLLSIRMWCICSAPTSWQGLRLLLILATRKGHPEFQLCR